MPAVLVEEVEQIRKKHLHDGSIRIPLNEKAEKGQGTHRTRRAEGPLGIANHKVQLAVMPRASASGEPLLSGGQSGLIGACF